MWMYKVESIAIEGNKHWNAGQQVSGGLGYEAGASEADSYRLYSRYEDAKRAADKLNHAATQFEKNGNGRQFFGQVTYVYIPVDEVDKLHDDFGRDEVEAATKLVVGG